MGRCRLGSTKLSERSLSGREDMESEVGGLQVAGGGTTTLRVCTCGILRVIPNEQRVPSVKQRFPEFHVTACSRVNQDFGSLLEPHPVADPACTIAVLGIDLAVMALLPVYQT